MALSFWSISLLFLIHCMLYYQSSIKHIYVYIMTSKHHKLNLCTINLVYVIYANFNFILTLNMKAICGEYKAIKGYYALISVTIVAFCPYSSNMFL